MKPIKQNIILRIINYARGLMKKSRLVSIESLHAANTLNAKLGAEVGQLKHKLAVLAEDRCAYIIIMQKSANKDAISKWATSLNVAMTEHHLPISNAIVARGDIRLPLTYPASDIRCMLVTGNENKSVRARRINKEFFNAK